MQNFKKHLLIALTLVIIIGCEIVVDIDMPPYSPQIVANCFFNPDSIWSAHISNSLASLDNGNIKDIESAVVLVFENNIAIDTLQHTSFGTYRSLGNKKPSAGKSYSLTVSADGYEAIYASDIIPQAVQITSASIQDSAGTDENNNIIAEVSINFNDPTGQENFYELELYQNYITDNNKIWFTSLDPSIEQDFNGESALFNDVLFNGKSYQLKINFDSYYAQGSSKIIVYLKSVSKPYYLYNKTVILHQQNQNNPFAEPVQVYNNIENGLGIFAGFSVDTIGL
ncbi:DUF4249 domain-containing protein [bacterium AH-315-M05]|nr:DUF4249 domain-containing protein [bacterium AH-315-M05]